MKMGGGGLLRKSTFYPSYKMILQYEAEWNRKVYTRPLLKILNHLGHISGTFYMTYTVIGFIRD